MHPLKCHLCGSFLNANSLTQLTPQPTLARAPCIPNTLTPKSDLLGVDDSEFLLCTEGKKSINII